MTPIISGIAPDRVIPGGRIDVSGSLLPVPIDGPPHVLIGGQDAKVVLASPGRLRAIVPAGLEGGSTAVRIDELAGETAYVEVARELVTGIHQVDSPLCLPDGRLLVTQSGGRGTTVPAPLFRVDREGVREPLTVEIPNPTSLALGPDGAIYVSSRFDGTVYRMTGDLDVETYATDLGVATGLAFGPDGALYVGDRSGSILRVADDRTHETFASLPSSVAAFHLAFGPDGHLYVTAPTLASRDSLYRITPDRLVETVCDSFGRPQGLAFDSRGTLHVVDALAGGAGLFAIDVTAPAPRPTLVVGASSLVGVAFDAAGAMYLASNDTIWRLE